MGRNESGTCRGRNTQVALMSGSVRCLVRNAKERRVSDRTTVPHERRIMGSGGHGAAIDVCTRSLVPDRIIILKRTMGIRSTGRGQSVHVHQRLCEWKRGVELCMKIKGRHVGGIKAGESIGIHAFTVGEHLRKELITIKVSGGMTVAGQLSMPLTDGIFLKSATLGVPMA